MTSGPASLIAPLAAERVELIASLRNRPRGLEWCREHAAIVDAAIARVAEAAGTDPVGIAIVATGGFGRAELAPHSDIDLVVTPAEMSDPELGTLFRLLHDHLARQLGLIVSYAYLPDASVAGLDHRTRTGLLDARLVWGARSAFERMESELTASLRPGEFILQKVREREAAESKTHDTPLVTEPHLKEGAGGLRSLAASNWIRRAIGATRLEPESTARLLFTARNLLHMLTGRLHDTLNPGRRVEVANLLGQDPLEFGARLAEEMRGVHERRLETWDLLRTASYAIAVGAESKEGRLVVEPTMDRGAAALAVVVASELGLRIAQGNWTNELATGGAIYKALTSGPAAVESLDRSGLLESLLPELTRTRTLMPRDSVHRYTVFQHSLMVLRLLGDRLPEGFLSNLHSEVRDHRPLYLAALLHDCGKAIPGQPHSESGEQLARTVASRLALGEDTTELLSFLIREHLTMARFIRLRDLDNAETIQEFARLMENRERLDLLTLLTWADVNAVSPFAWTDAQQSLLQKLHRAVSAAFESPEDAPARGFRAIRHAERRLAQEDVSEEAIAKFIDLMPSAYFVGADESSLLRDFTIFSGRRKDEVAVEFEQLLADGVGEFFVCCQDRPGLLSDVLAVLYAFDLALVSATICTTRSSEPIVLDHIRATYAGKAVPRGSGQRIADVLKDVLEGNRSADEVLRAQGKDPSRVQRELSYTLFEGEQARLEVRAPQGRGLAFRVVKRLSQAGFDITAARFGQWAGQAAATFYLRQSSGSAIDRPTIEAALSADQS